MSGSDRQSHRQTQQDCHSYQCLYWISTPVLLCTWSTEGSWLLVLILLYNLAMEIFTVQEFQENWDELIKRVEDGEHIGIINDSGAACVMMSTDDALYKLYTEHEEGS